MKIKEVYLDIKNKNNKHLLFIKSGMFYNAFDEDANIINLIFEYKISNNKIGLPVIIINKVMCKLNEIEINYIVYNFDDSSIFKKFNNNNYDYYYNMYKKKEYEEKNKKILIERITYLINSNKENYNKIKKFIDEYEF